MLHHTSNLVRPLQATAAVPHPKMTHLVDVLTDHFVAHKQQQQQAAAAAAAVGGEDGEDGGSDAAVPDVTRAMVFISYREQVALVWQHLKQLEPDIVCRCVYVCMMALPLQVQAVTACNML